MPAGPGVAPPVRRNSEEIIAQGRNTAEGAKRRVGANDTILGGGSGGGGGIASTPTEKKTLLGQ